MAELKNRRCVLGFVFIMYSKVVLSNIGTVDVEIDTGITLPNFLRFIPPVILSVLILLTMYYWIRWRQSRSTIAKFLTVEFFVVLFSFVLLPIDDACEMTITDWPNCITVNLSAQLVVFASIISQISHSRFVKGCSYLLLFVAIIVLLLYEKTADVILSVVFVLLIFTNPFIIKISKFFILESPYFERIREVSISKHVISSI